MRREVADSSGCRGVIQCREPARPTEGVQHHDWAADEPVLAAYRELNALIANAVYNAADGDRMRELLVALTFTTSTARERCVDASPAARGRPARLWSTALVFRRPTTA